MLSWLLVVSCFLLLSAAQSCQDKFGTNQVFASASNGANWVSQWDKGGTLSWTNTQKDPNDGRCYGRGSGASYSTSGGIMTMSGDRLRYWCNVPNKNVEMTVYWKGGDKGQRNRVYYEGLTLIARSNHVDRKKNPCNAASYYLRLHSSRDYRGRLCVTKEYYHAANGTAYSGDYPNPNDWFPCIKVISGTTWPSGFIGMKFVVQTIDSSTVNLRGYVDLTSGGVNGGRWEKIIDLNDRPGDMPPRDWDIQLANLCPMGTSKGIIAGPGNYFALRADYVLSNNPYTYKYFSVREISPNVQCGGTNAAVVKMVSWSTITNMVLDVTINGIVPTKVIAYFSMDLGVGLGGIQRGVQNGQKEGNVFRFRNAWGFKIMPIDLKITVNGVDYIACDAVIRISRQGFTTLITVTRGSSATTTCNRVSGAQSGASVSGPGSGNSGSSSNEKKAPLAAIIAGSIGGCVLVLLIGFGLGWFAARKSNLTREVPLSEQGSYVPPNMEPVVVE